MDIAALASQVMRYIMTTLGAFGTAVWAKAQDTAADETVSLGRRLLQRLGAREESRPALEGAVADAVAEPADEDYAAALRGQIKKALAADPALAAEIEGMLAAAPIVAGPGSQIMADNRIGGSAVQIGSARDVDIRHQQQPGPADDDARP
ncbi:hypothetical protein SAMN05444920_14811 [Nonomuraea solani]|uniref:Uncharacterized protein n=1 Tax=Nonomuraea solani TaxID=1144553 RepID=A0A1H6F3U4_9ACTN|nr:hypothetical protein [Nonomuraea solani]SEH03919.1 hypothetical protein SAMN05444920_14811 [Nonomuraea solani]